MSAPLPVLTDLPQKPAYVPLEIEGDFFDLFQKVESHYDHCFLLESLGEETYDSRHAVMGFAPRHLVEARDDALLVDGKTVAAENPYYALRSLFPRDVISRLYAGGLVGYLGYDASNYMESTLDLAHHPHFPAFQLGLYTDGLIQDKLTGQVFYFHYGEDRSDEIRRLASEPGPAPARPVVNFYGFSKSREEHAAMVAAAREEIVAGNTFQCQIGFKAHYEIRGPKLPIYARLRQINPSPHMFYLKFGPRVIMGASPELIFRLRQGELETFPLAGTIHRGATPEEDRELARKLLNDPKEIAEHNMLVDLHRNDLGRVARFGTVKVRRLFDIKRFSHVQHISSEVVGIIRRDHDMFSGLAGSFPAGTLSGAPKIESMKIIDRLEQDPRGPYGGAIGHFGLNGDSTFAIPIRSLFCDGETAFNQASGGIVYDSVVENEYREVLNKLAGMARALQEFEE